MPYAYCGREGLIGASSPKKVRVRALLFFTLDVLSHFLAFIRKGRS
jgi:hypothetical protein